MASRSVPVTPSPSFTGKNYHIWSSKMRNYLETFDLWDMVVEDKHIPSLPSNPTVAQIKQHGEEKAKRSKAILQNVVSDSIFNKIMNCKTAKEQWDTLKEEYQGSDRTRQMQVLNLKRDFEVQSMQENEQSASILIEFQQL